MARKFNILFIVVAILAATLHCSVAQTTHVVGDSLGWHIPPGGSIAYTTWASRQTFTVGDVLVFNFTTGQHDVAQVSRTSFDGCNTTSPISLITNGPANITLTTAGEHYYICTFSRHCDLGQKLAINVSAAPSTSPPPQSATPSPVAPAPSPSTTPQTYVVGDSLGWNIPPGGAIAYRTWAANKTFVVGDILVFNFTSGSHDVAVLPSKAAYDSCNISATATPITTSPARITLTTPGEHFYICTFPQHCSLGQKLAINVTGTAATPSPTPSPASAPTRPPSSPTPAPAPAPSSTGATPPPSSATPPPSSSTTPAPSGSTTPSTPSPPGVSAPPPPNSAPTFAVVALPFTFLSIALAFFF